MSVLLLCPLRALRMPQKRFYVQKNTGTLPRPYDALQGSKQPNNNSYINTIIRAARSP